MFYKFLPSLITLLIATFSYSQVPVAESRLTLSEEMKEPSSSTITDYLGQDENDQYILRSRSKSTATFSMNNTVFILESYGKDLSLKKRQELEPEIKGFRAELETVKYLDGNLYAFILYINKKGAQTELYYQAIDKKTLLLSGTPKKILIIPYDSRNKQGDFTYKLSIDRKKIAIIASVHDDKNLNEKFATAVFDAGMNNLWEKQITLPYESELFEKEQLLLDNNGNIYLSGRLYNEKAKEKRKGVANYTYKILAYRDKGIAAREYEVNLSGQFITDIGFNITTDDKLAVAGFYSTQGTYSIKGISFTLIDAASGVVLKQGSKPFDASFLELFTRSQVDKKDQELYRYSLDKIIIRSDGGVLLLAEQYYVEAYTTRDYYNGQYVSRTTYYYNYNDIMAINVNPNMTIAWATKIPKRQVTTNDNGYYSSYAYAVAGDKIYLLFNDNPDNLLVTDPAQVAKYSGVQKSVATLVTISSDGKWKKSLLFSNREQGQILRPKICKQVSDTEFFLYAEKGRNYVIGKAVL
ncbi:MAG TPA: hypothetical protein PLD84_00720 [Chitinophagales bacterium]|nr:hypothetical protein [Chitinophagales bacterium]